jgi:Spy/CpxP family protein refolding chaperone
MSCLTLSRFGVLFVVFAFLCSAAPAQAQVQPVRFQTPRLALLWNEAVQKELKLSDEQRQKIKSALDEMFEDEPGGLKRLKMPPMGFHPGPEEFVKLDQRLEQIMNADQVKRWNELYVQHLGYRALALPHVVKELKLTKDQQTKLDELMEDVQRKLRETYKTHHRVPPELLVALDKELAQAVSPLLSPEQKKQWETLQGTKFTFTKQPPLKKDK